MWNKYKYLIIIIALVAVSAGLFLGVAGPAIKKISKGKIEIQRQHDNFKMLLEKGQGFAKNKDNFDLIKSRLEVLESVCLNPGEELSFITDMEEIAAANDVKQDIVFSADEARKTNDITIIPVRLSLVGELNNVINYINQIEALDYYININEVNISAQGAKTIKANPTTVIDEMEEAEAPEIQLKLAGYTYWK